MTKVISLVAVSGISAVHGLLNNCQVAVVDSGTPSTSPTQISAPEDLSALVSINQKASKAAVSFRSGKAIVAPASLVTLIPQKGRTFITEEVSYDLTSKVPFTEGWNGKVLHKFGVLKTTLPRSPMHVLNCKMTFKNKTVSRLLFSYNSNEDIGVKYITVDEEDNVYLVTMKELRTVEKIKRFKKNMTNKYYCQARDVYFNFARDFQTALQTNKPDGRRVFTRSLKTTSGCKATLCQHLKRIPKVPAKVPELLTYRSYLGDHPASLKCVFGLLGEGRKPEPTCLGKMLLGDGREPEPTYWDKMHDLAVMADCGQSFGLKFQGNSTTVILPKKLEQLRGRVIQKMEEIEPGCSERHSPPVNREEQMLIQIFFLSFSVALPIIHMLTRSKPSQQLSK